ncbi:MAG: hypothetical protein IJR94_04065 [Synergistaceae bacterium]|nr:hypothetical protein [Synergistaceae bacterium]
MADNEQWSERLAPPSQSNIKNNRSYAKRIALFIFMGAGALFMLLMVAIMSATDNIISSAPPDEVLQPSTQASAIIPVVSTPPETQPEEMTVPEPDNTDEQAPKLTPIYVPAPQPQSNAANPYAPSRRGSRTRGDLVTENQRTLNSARLQAASSPTVVAGFVSESSSSPNSEGVGMFTNTQTPSASGANDANAALTAAAGLQQGLMNAMTGTGDTTTLQPIDPNGWQRKRDFLNQALPAEYSTHILTPQATKYELKAGTVIPSVLITGLNSDLPGNLIGQVSENVWDTATGKYLLIPRGTRIIGEYDSQIAYGQNRALVIWNRLIFPDGSTLVLDNLQGTDQSGYSGFKGKVDRHWGQIVGASLLVSLLSAGAELASPRQNNRGNNRDTTDARTILSENMARAVAQAMTGIIQRELNRAPTITIKPGYRFMVFVRQDIAFPKTWR